MIKSRQNTVHIIYRLYTLDINEVIYLLANSSYSPFILLNTSTKLAIDYAGSNGTFNNKKLKSIKIDTQKTSLSQRVIL